MATAAAVKNALKAKPGPDPEAEEATPEPQSGRTEAAAPGVEVVPARPVPKSPLAIKVEYAKLLASSGLLPPQYRRQPANLLWAIEYGEMLGLSPMAAINGVHVIEGKPTASAGLISALVRRAGHRLRVQGDDSSATCTIIRADDPDVPFTVTWTLDRAKQAGLTGKDVWKKYPAAMLKARAISECARDACEEALSGVHYTPEEMGADPGDDSGESIAFDPATGEVLAHESGPTSTSGETKPSSPEAPTPAAADAASPVGTAAAGQAPGSSAPPVADEPGTTSPAQQIADQAAVATDRDVVLELGHQAYDEGLLDTPVDAAGEKGPLGRYLTFRAGQLAAAAPAAADEDGIVDAEVVEDGEPTVEDARANAAAWAAS